MGNLFSKSEPAVNLVKAKTVSDDVQESGGKAAASDPVENKNNEPAQQSQHSVEDEQKTDSEDVVVIEKDVAVISTTETDTNGEVVVESSGSDAVNDKIEVVAEAMSHLIIDSAISKENSSVVTSAIEIQSEPAVETLLVSVHDEQSTQSAVEEIPSGKDKIHAEVDPLEVNSTSSEVEDIKHSHSEDKEIESSPDTDKNLVCGEIIVAEEASCDGGQTDNVVVDDGVNEVVDVGQGQHLAVEAM